MQYTITIHDHTYSSFVISPPCPHINPITHRLFSKDIFTISPENKPILVDSPIQRTPIPGILLLENNQTYGKYKNKYYYKCIPNNRELPHFLIPYELKIGFSKKYTNLFVLFQYIDWNKSHPHGSLLETIGPIDNLFSFNEYQLHCKQLYHTIKPLIEKTKQLHTIHSIIERFSLTNRLQDKVYTIDSKETHDFDDAFSVKYTNHTIQLSIYIANVFFWLEYSELWNVMSKRISTIYLPDNKKTLLSPAINNACSLKKGEWKAVSIMDITIDLETGSLGEPLFSNGYICVSENYHYDDPLLFENTSYQLLKDHLHRTNDSVNSHDIITDLMVLINTKYAEQLYSNGHGIYKQIPEASAISKSLIKWSLGEYVLSDSVQTKYTHMSSPIRRLVDIINQTIFFHYVEKQPISQDALDFINKYTSSPSIQYINQSMKSIRQIQFHSNILHRCFQDSTIMEREHEGMIVESDNEKYTVYLTEYKLWTMISVSDLDSDLNLEKYSTHRFRIFLFEEENTFMKKIRLQIIT